MKISGNIVDIIKKQIYPGKMKILNGKITNIKKLSHIQSNYLIPGFIDAHLHIESTMLTPQEFGKNALKHGKVAVVADPHEIANVMAVDGVKFLIENGRKSPLKFYYGVPSCVPATSFETSGAKLGLREIEELLKMKEITHLGEMMNFPGVINSDKIVLQKLALARKFDKPVDGHAPGLTGENLKKYSAAGIYTEHECTSKE